MPKKRELGVSPKIRTLPGDDVQLTAVARETERAVVEPAGFTLVEEDDVAFSLSLCREVNRLYGLYEQGRMKPSRQLEGGLMVSIEMLALVARSVTTGMPAMRITVAGAQLREMMSVLFDADPFTGAADRTVRDGFRSLLREMHPAAVPPTAPAGLPPAADIPEPPAADVAEPLATESDASAVDVPAGPAERRGRLRRFFKRDRSR